MSKTIMKQGKQEWYGDRWGPKRSPEPTTPTPEPTPPADETPPDAVTE